MVLIRDEAHGWLRLGEVAPQLLTEARVQLHWASQLVAAVGATHLPPAKDDVHTTMQWMAGHEVLAGERAWNGKPFRAALRVAALSVVILDLMDRPMDELHLDGRTLEDARVWLETEIADYVGAQPKSLDVPVCQMPRHPVAGGRVFQLESAGANLELARWYVGADVVLRELAAETPYASPVRCWPDRLDLRTSISMAPVEGAHGERAIRVGMCPGDTVYPDPYWYVAAHPRPEHAPELPRIGHGGEWYDGPWLGATLRSRHLLPGSASGQRERLVAFLEPAIAACRELLTSPA
jgi:hypothetical protein